MNEFSFTPRPYQLSTRHKCNELLNRGEHPLIVLDTGLGKTKTLFMIISDRIKLGKRIYVTVPNKEVFDQLLSEYSEMGLNPGYINSEGVRGLDRSLYICMFQSLFNNLNLIPESLHPDEIYNDEAHHSLCSSISDICNFFPKALRLGMTATATRIDNKPLGDLYTQIVNEIDIKTAIEKKYLTPPLLIAPDQYIDDIPIDGVDFDNKKQAELLGDLTIIGDVIAMYERVLNGLPCLVACSTYDHAKIVMQSFIDVGWKAEHIHSKLNDFERKAMTKRISSGETNILCTVGVGVEGWSCDNLAGLIWLRRTMSVTIWKQFNGRVLRLKEGKKYGIIIDPVGNSVIHGMPDRVYNWNLETGVDDEELEDLTAFKVCWSCGVYNHVDNIECHWCGISLEDETKTFGTCRRCSNWRDMECSFSDSIFTPCPIWLQFPGCPSFTKKGRSLPTIIDGNLIPVYNEEMAEELRQSTINKKKEIKEKMQEEERLKTECESIDSFEKRKIIQKGLFADDTRRSLFAEALGGV
jgi:superfamily II DNA or RNA helicase